MRGLSDSFMDDLLNPEGLLHPLLERIKQDQTLMLAIRKNYINIYYRGGNILKVKELKRVPYIAFFNTKYAKNTGIPIPKELGEIKGQECTKIIKNIDDLKGCVGAFQKLKRIMDFYFSLHSNSEREFQQLIVRENNLPMLSKKAAKMIPLECKYFITDIEFQEIKNGPRFDMSAIRLLKSEQKNTWSLQPALIEMKYGDDSLKGDGDDNNKENLGKPKPGLIKHLQDIDALIADDGRYRTLIETMQFQFKQLCSLGLIKFSNDENIKEIIIDSVQTPEVIVILTNHNPLDPVLGNVLNYSKIDVLEKSRNFHLKFHVSSFSGYALHSDCMVSLEEFRKLVTPDKSDLCVTAVGINELG